MIDYSEGRGKLKPDFNYNTLLKQIDDKKMISSKAVFINDDDIKRIMSTPKVLIGDLGIGDEILSINKEFGKINDFDSKEFCFCEQNIQLFMSQTEVNDELVTETTAIATYKNGNSYSIGLYYIPEGKLENICLVARVCDHNGFNDHKNEINGEIIDKNDTHIHMINEKYIMDAYKLHKNDEEALIKSLRSPDAFKIQKLKNISEMADYAKKSFCVTNEKLYTMTESQSQGSLLEEIQCEMNNIKNKLEM